MADQEEFGPISENSKNWYRKGYKPVSYEEAMAVNPEN